MEILISGLGIGGPALAWWLERRGFKPVIVERASAPREAGYIIDFWGRGYDIAGAMGLLPALECAGYHVDEVRLVGDDGRRVGGFGADVFDRVTGGRFVSLPRGALSLELYRAISDRVEVIFDDSIAAIGQRDDSVRIEFEKSPAREVAMVIGADGVHSNVRDLAFGPEAEFERFLGYGFAAFTLPGYAPRDPDVYVIHGEPKRQIARFAQRDGSTLVLMIWTEDTALPLPERPDEAKAMLRDRFGGVAWEARAMLDALDDCGTPYVDRVSQIRVGDWSRGRVALLGDAAFAPSFLAGQGSALAMIGAYVLAGEIEAARGDAAAAFAAYQNRLRGFLDKKQDAAAKFARSFVPSTRFGIRFREIVSRLMNIGFVADLAIGGSVRDAIDLPAYGAIPAPPAKAD